MDRLKSLLAWLKTLLLSGFTMFQDNKMSVYSGYATLFIVTAVFPCVILIISIVNLLPGYSTEDVAGIFFQILPDLGPIKELIESMMVNLKAQSGGLLASAAAVTTLWAASKGVSAVQKGLNQLDETDETELATADETAVETTDVEAVETTDETKKKKRGELIEKGKSLAKAILKRLLFTLTLIILIPALLVFEMLGDSIAGVIHSALEKVNPEGLSGILSHVDILFNVTSLAVILFALLVILQIFAFLPDKRRTMKSQLPGALLTVVCWFVFTELFSFFIPRFYHASSLYGSLASLFLLLLWLRFIVMILFAGGVLNRTLEEEKQEKECS